MPSPTFPSSAFSIFVLLAGLLTPIGVTRANTGAIIEWVTPPAWLQTQTENSSAMPGKSFSGRAWITTGRGGRALVRVGNEQIEIDENSVWEWSGLDDGSSGNAIQGGVRMSTTRASAGSMPPTTTTTSAEQALRFYRNAPWILLLDVGNDQAAGLKLVDFLSNSGYPVKAARQGQTDNSAKWQIWLEGLPSKDAAVAVGARLRALTPAILSASPELRESFKLTGPKW